MIAETLGVIFSAAASDVAADALKQFSKDYLRDKVKEYKSNKDKNISAEKIKEINEEVENKPTLITNDAFIDKTFEIIRTIVDDIDKVKDVEFSLSVLRNSEQRIKTIMGERTRQVKLAFNIAAALSIAGIIIIFGSIIFMVVSSADTKAIVSAIVGAVTEAVSLIAFRFNKEANDRLDNIGNDANNISKMQIAIEVASKIEDKKTRDQTIKEVALEIAKSQKIRDREKA